MKDLRDIIKAFSAATSDMALATVVDTLGTSFRKPGTRMLVLGDGQAVGSLSEGCLEEEVVHRAQSVIETGVPTCFWMDTQKRSGCHGSVQIFIEWIRPGNAFLQYLAQCMAERQPALAVVCMEPDSPCAGSSSRHLAGKGRPGFEQILLPPVRLILVGDTPGNEGLLSFAHALGWSAIVSAPAEVADFDADERTAIVIKNHHEEKDFVALKWALSQTFGYVGLLGPRPRKERLLERLLEEGWEPDNAMKWDVYGPAGLDLGATEPEETALSIIAEIQAVMTRSDGGFLRDCERSAASKPTPVVS
ncbi:Xanthine and CO dehydrogenase maturation factor, XdhC/CoxF family [Prosthecobacter debontii]|uniref:Xanthine and CO dehydrogenase maturation factor, XdhC/CoxF family n=1 Tax=Prosthecobacter debontii TaxID=48467 RepID=A0A1T4YPF5_9BACT|nr:XdhC family protein [Prosthecobacter debontii]SKB03707.1 Xanthine and CO dehydrogenase maturation factor, XdhC/CoxF family [Prosthecobacter debontii]